MDVVQACHEDKLLLRVSHGIVEGGGSVTVLERQAQVHEFGDGALGSALAQVVVHEAAEDLDSASAHRGG